MTKILGIIPARFNSSRFPGKPLVDICGKPLVIHVCEKVEAALGKEATFVATDDEKIKEVVEDYGYNVMMTHSNHPTGTDRLYEVSMKLDADIYINIQGDEPLVNPEDILKIAEEKRQNPDFVINGMFPINLETEDPNSVNIPKLVVNRNNYLVYMSRLPVPGIKDTSKKPTYLKQICIYAFTKQELKLYGENGGKELIESFEDIEILRFLELGHKVKMVMMSGESLAVDLPEDVERVENFIKNGL
jgi:3-deoxy-manno-octulosonate cytidylyltransferase (CMP-KDO synthetase)